MSQRAKQILIGMGVSLAVAATSLSVARSEPVTILVDRAKILKLDQPASMVVIGNPLIADASIQGGNMLVLTGRSYGSTNLIVLDGEGKEIVNQMLQVKAADDRLVTVYRGTARASYTCMPTCERTLMLGDSSEDFDTVNGQISTRNSLSEGAASR